MAWTWIFQAKPAEWDLERQLAEQPTLLWKVSAFRNDIKPDDTVYMWESGPNARLLARCRVTARPRKQPLDPKFAEYSRHPKYDDPEMVRSRVRVEQVLRPPLHRDELWATSEELAKLAPIGGVPAARQGTTFSVPPAPAAILSELCASRL